MAAPDGLAPSFFRFKVGCSGWLSFGANGALASAGESKSASSDWPAEARAPSLGSWVDQRDLHPHCGLHRAGCYCYIMINIGNGAPARTCTSNLRLRRAACRTLTLRELENGTPCRCCPGFCGVKGRYASRYINGALWKMAAVSGIAPDSSRFQRDANLSQLHSLGSPAWTRTTTTRLTDGHAALTSQGNEMVPPRGFAPRSSAYRAGALLLSYEGLGKNGRAPRCCPGCLLAPNEAGLLTPSRAVSEKWLARLAPDRCGGVSPRAIRFRERRPDNGLLRDAPAMIMKSGCGGRIRTGDARRMKPLPYHLATPLFIGKFGTASRYCPEPARIWKPRCAN